MELDWIENDVRIRRNDRYGFVTQKLTRVDVCEGGGKGKGPGRKTGETKLVWQDRGYFSHLKEMAAKDLIDEAGEGGCCKELLASIKRLESRIHVLIADADKPHTEEVLA